MLQNRVDPFGTIFATTARGTMTGTRGIIHNDHQEITRAFRHKAWITCLLEFKGRWRAVMSPKRYTELFFLDEATSFAAGHRPCNECRRADARQFKSCWIAGNPDYGFNARTSINDIDAILHRERIDRNGEKVTFCLKGADLPPGAFVSVDGNAMLVGHGHLYIWSPFGYKKGPAVAATQEFIVLTPKSVVNAFRAGYGLFGLTDLIK